LAAAHRRHPRRRGAGRLLPLCADQAVFQEPAAPVAQADEVRQRRISGHAGKVWHSALPPVVQLFGFPTGLVTRPRSRPAAPPPACRLPAASSCHNDNLRTATMANPVRFAGVIFAHTVTHTTSVALPPAAVLERAKRFFAERVPPAAAYVA